MWHAVFGTDVQTRFSRTARLTHDPSEIRFSGLLNHTADTARVSASFVRAARPSRVVQPTCLWVRSHEYFTVLVRPCYTRAHVHTHTHTHTHTRTSFRDHYPPSEKWDHNRQHQRTSQQRQPHLRVHQQLDPIPLCSLISRL